MKTPPQGYVSQAAHNELKRLLANAIAAKEQAERDRDGYMALSATRANKAQAAEKDAEALRAGLEELREGEKRLLQAKDVLCKMLVEAVAREVEARLGGDA